ncbi:MAG: methylaspartate ammonia-lyase [Clostridia bacterium]|nr:methylaspartate ammonia-lyase [Clostridia bacterium]
MKIKNIICAPGRTGFFFDDQLAIKAGAKADGAAYHGVPITPGFLSVRQAGESVSVMVLLENGEMGFGDCAAVQYSGAGGRDPLFLAENFIPFIQRHVTPLFVDEPADCFIRLCHKLEEIRVDGKPLHTAIRYGFSQAFLDAVSKALRLNMCDVVAKEYQTQVATEMIPLFAQSGDNRTVNADKMIMKHASVLPHGLINNMSEKLGEDGELLLDYVRWLRERILSLRTSVAYQPILHLDVYGTIGQAFGSDNYGAMADYCAKLEQAAKPFLLHLEGPMDSGSRVQQMTDLRELTALLDERNINVVLVADEWCNTLEDVKYFADNRAGHMLQIKTPDLGSIHNTAEAVLYCKANGLLAYQGGTCNETDRSAQVCAHVAMATGPRQILAKPGMGVDEGMMIAYNEMSRVLALRKAGFGVWHG